MAPSVPKHWPKLAVISSARPNTLVPVSPASPSELREFDRHSARIEFRGCKVKNDGGQQRSSP